MSEIKKTYSAPDSLIVKLVTLLTGAVLMGAAWRIRGDLGYGGFWGMMAVAVLFCTFIFSRFGFEKKQSYAFFSLTALLFAITNGGWGTLNIQICGMLRSSISNDEMVFIEISPYSGVAIMLLLGFGWAPLFGFFLGQYFSGRKYGLKNNLEAIGLFYVLKYVFMATLSHPLMKIICPKGVALFEDSLTEAGVSGTAYGTYMSNFNDMSFAKAIAGGRNYFTSVEVIAMALAALCLIVYLYVRFKDGRAARTMLAVCASFAVAITLADLFIFYQHGGVHMTQFAQHQDFAGWSFWEYFTGFFAGLFITGYLLCLKKSTLESASQAEGLSLNKAPKVLRFAAELVLTGMFTFGAVFIVPLGERAKELPGISETLTYIVTGVLLTALYFAIAYRNIIKKGLSAPLDMSLTAFCKKALPVCFAIHTLLYWFTGNAYGIHWLKGEPISQISILMLISVPLFYIGYAVISRNGNRSIE